MNEKAFIVKVGSRLAERYIKSRDEKQKSHDLSKQFFEKYITKDNIKYAFISNLTVELTNDLYEKYKSQLKKGKYDVCHQFKANSPMSKLWLEEVYNKVDISAISNFRIWYFDFIRSGRHAMWDYNGIIYGLVESNYDNDIKLSDDVEEIKLSEYYAVVEKYNEEHNISK